jgi:anaerobic selenocysteine-containing dehydrogenase
MFNQSKDELTLLQRLIPKWVDPSGPLTVDLVQEPSNFGIGKVPKKLLPTSTTQMVCGYCSTGCSLNVHLQDGQAVNLTPSHSYPVNQGMACPKGWEALSALHAPDRGTKPLLRDARGRLKPVEWDVALKEFCSRFKSIQAEHGPHSVAFLGTGQMPTEELAFLGSLAKFGMGMLHGDGNTRQCMATSVVAYKQAFGFDAPPYTYQDFEESDVIVLIGSNLCVAHPIMWQRVLKNRNNPKIIVIDPRCTETAMAATEHVQLKPKSDLQLLYAIANILISNGWIDRKFIDCHTNGFDAFAEHVRAYDVETVSQHSGISTIQLQRLAKSIHDGERVSLWWTMGVNQSYEGVRTAQAIINIAMMTGNIGQPGTGANSITGQCNAMGSRLFSNTTNLLGGYDFMNPDHRAKVGGILGIDPGLIPDQNSLPYHRILEDVLRGKIKGLWIVCTNTAHSWINQDAARDILDRLDFLVVQDMYSTTETVKHAHLYFPAAGWGEKDGTFINSERRIGVIKKVSVAPGQALSDFNIFRAVAQYWGCGEMFHDWDSPAAVFEKLKQVSKGQPCDISGIEDYQMIDAMEGIQWPYPATALHDHSPAGGAQRRLFADGKFFHADGRAIFCFESSMPMPEPINASFPYTLLTGRGSAAQWHTETRTGKSKVLRSLSPKKPFVEINPKDAKAKGIVSNQELIVESQRGSVRVVAVVTPTVAEGQVYMTMHFEETNRLTLAHFDPYSHQPSYKNCAVNVRKPETRDVR